MRIIYDPEADALYISFTSQGKYAESEEIEQGIIVDYSEDGKIIGIEILNVKEKLEEVKDLEKVFNS